MLKKLRTGAEEDSAVVAAVCVSLEGLLSSGNAVAFYEVVMVARDREHRPWGNTAITSMKLALLDSPMGEMHNSVRNVILASTEGKGMEMRMVFPYTS